MDQDSIRSGGVARGVWQAGMSITAFAASVFGCSLCCAPNSRSQRRRAWSTSLLRRSRSRRRNLRIDEASDLARRTCAFPFVTMASLYRALEYSQSSRAEPAHEGRAEIDRIDVDPDLSEQKLETLHLQPLLRRPAPLQLFPQRLIDEPVGADCLRHPAPRPDRTPRRSARKPASRPRGSQRECRPRREKGLCRV